MTMAALAAGALAVSAAAQAAPSSQPGSQKSLAEMARDALRSKPAPSPTTKVWTNDNIPTSSGISTVGTPAPAAPASVGGEGEEAAAGPAESKPRSPEELKQLEAQWRQKFQDQKDKISLLQRELDVLKRENQIRAATYYADAGNRMRYENQAKYAADDRKYQADTAAKQQQLDAAKQQLEDMREQLRKAGLPSSWGD
ncbi:MAG TPA: hypothetical protein VEG08_07280 [Terriglobales bacterium]|nr:hypothetical protein [Terriglobales bacterium]